MAETGSSGRAGVGSKATPRDSDTLELAAGEGAGSLVEGAFSSRHILHQLGRPSQRTLLAEQVPLNRSSSVSAPPHRHPRLSEE